MLDSYSVIVPTLNRRTEIDRTLRSIEGSMAYFEANHPRAGQVDAEIVVVDEGSTDGTAERVEGWAQSSGRLRLLRHQRSFGIGAARNTAARSARGAVLFFCDGDDCFLPEHVFVGFSLLDLSDDAASSAAEVIRLRVGDRGHLAFSPRAPVAAVRTGVRLSDPVHPYWKIAIQNTIAQCLCVRRECHDWGEGFPEELVYKRIGGSEDVAYGDWLETFFRVGRVDLETVEYSRRPGNSLDRQIDRFARPPDARADAATPEQRALHDIRLLRESQKMGYLLDKWCVLGAPPVAPALLNWAGVTAELERRRRASDARRVASQAARCEHPLSGGHTLDSGA
jgi:glycosyltransferase involved in cell wall biosynthesis